MRGDLIRGMSGYGMDDRSWRIVLKNSKKSPGSENLANVAQWQFLPLRGAVESIREPAIAFAVIDLAVNFTIMIGEDVA